MSTSDVVSTSAPQTTCTLLIHDVALAQHRQRAERHLDGDQATSSSARPREQLAPAAMVLPDVRRRREDRQRDDQRADAVREVDRDLRIPVIGDERGRTSAGSPESPGRRPVCRIVAPTRICA